MTGKSAQPEYEMNAEGHVLSGAGVDRGTFIMRVYGHLIGAIAGFVLLEIALFKSGIAEQITRVMMGNWLLVLGGFMLISWMARGLASRATGLGAQYGGLALYVLGQAIIFAPMLYIAEYRAGGGVIRSAAILTALGFIGLTLIAFQTRKDFSFLGGILRWVGVMALVTIVAAVLFGLELGTWFSLAMVAFAGAAILYDTSKIMYYWPPERHVGAALELFASVALMFWYILRLLMGRR